ncbi:MAG: hypothetical protein ACK46M_15300, partial [Planctomyces sp.]
MKPLRQAKKATVSSTKQCRGDLRHDDDSVTLCGDTAYQLLWQSIRFGQQRMKCGDDRFVTVVEELGDLAAPGAGVQTELVLEADHIAGAIVGDVCSPPAGIRDLVVDDVDNASVLSGVLMELL